MKIDKLGQQQTIALPEVERQVSGKQPQPDFGTEFGRVQDDQLKQHLNKLMSQITEQGRNLSKVPTWAELKRYRELVRRFMGEAVKKMHSLQSQHGWDRFARQKVYTTVKKVDQALEELTEMVRQGQTNQLDILARLDAIRGMLVDLYT